MNSMIARRLVLMSHSRLNSTMPIITVPKYLQSEMKRHEARTVKEYEELMAKASEGQ